MADVKKKLTIKIKTPELTKQEIASVKKWSIDISLRWMGTGWEPKITAECPQYEGELRYPMADLLPGDSAAAEYTMAFSENGEKTNG